MRQLITVKEAAAMLAITEWRAYELARRGQLPGVVRIGRYVRFDPGALEEFIQAGGNVRERIPA